MRRPTIQLQNLDGSHCKFITSSEASALINGKWVKRIYRKKARRMVLRLLPPVKPSESSSSSNSISYEEMLAFVGIGEPGAISAARAKVRLFHPSLHGARAA